MNSQITFEPPSRRSRRTPQPMNGPTFDSLLIHVSVHISLDNSAISSSMDFLTFVLASKTSRCPLTAYSTVVCAAEASDFTVPICSSHVEERYLVFSGALCSSRISTRSPENSTDASPSRSDFNLSTCARCAHTIADNIQFRFKPCYIELYERLL